MIKIMIRVRVRIVRISSSIHFTAFYIVVVDLLKNGRMFATLILHTDLSFDNYIYTYLFSN